MLLIARPLCDSALERSSRGKYLVLVAVKIHSLETVRNTCDQEEPIFQHLDHPGYHRLVLEITTTWNPSCVCQSVRNCQACTSLASHLSRAHMFEVRLKMGQPHRYFCLTQDAQDLDVKLQNTPS